MLIQFELLSLDFLQKASLSTRKKIINKLRKIEKIALYEKDLIDKRKLRFYSRAIFYAKLHFLELFDLMHESDLSNRIEELLLASDILLLFEKNRQALSKLDKRYRDFKAAMRW